MRRMRNISCRFSLTCESMGVSELNAFFLVFAKYVYHIHFEEDNSSVIHRLDRFIPVCE